MREVWVLTERTDFDRGGKYDFQNYENGCWVFYKFEDAVKAMRNRMKTLATSENSMFDGKGHIKEFNAYIDRQPDEDVGRMPSVSDLLATLFVDEDTWFESADLPKIDWTNYMFVCKLNTNKNAELLIRGDADGPSNDVNPYIHINTFTMNDPKKKYYCHIEDQFDWDQHFTSHLFLDLQRVVIEE